MSNEQPNQAEVQEDSTAPATTPQREPIKRLSLSPYEVFERVQAVRAQTERAKILVDYQSFALRTILQVNFNDWIKLDLPDGAPPYTEDTNPAEFSLARIDNSIKILKELVPGGRLPKPMKERRFIELLESMHAKNAKIMIAIKDKKLEKLYPAMTSTLVSKAFPNLIRNK